MQKNLLGRSKLQKNLLGRSKLQKISLSRLKLQKNLLGGQKCRRIYWEVEVAEEYRLQTETLYLAVSYIDRFLSLMSVVRAKLQLVGTAAMFIAA